jgi:hypothetical protein
VYLRPALTCILWLNPIAYCSFLLVHSKQLIRVDDHESLSRRIPDMVSALRYWPGGCDSDLEVGRC